MVYFTTTLTLEESITLGVIFMGIYVTKSCIDSIPEYFKNFSETLSIFYEYSMSNQVVKSCLTDSESENESDSESENEYYKKLRDACTQTETPSDITKSDSHAYDFTKKLESPKVWTEYMYNYDVPNKKEMDEYNLLASTKNSPVYVYTLYRYSKNQKEPFWYDTDRKYLTNEELFEKTFLSINDKFKNVTDEHVMEFEDVKPYTKEKIVKSFWKKFI